LRFRSLPVLAVLSGGLLAGCAPAHVPEPVTVKYGANDDNAQFEFWRQLSERPLTSNDEAFHGLLLYLYQKDPVSDYAGRVRLLKDRAMLPASFDRPGDEAVSRGVLAVAVARVLKIRGGLMMHLTGNNPRYSLLELQDMELFPPSSENQTFSGGEFVGIIGKMEDYQHGDTGNLPATDLGPPAAGTR